MNYKIQYDPSSRKFRCPECGQKTFVKFIDADGNYFEDIYGTCDRKNNCNYSKRPIKVNHLKPILYQTLEMSIFPHQIYIKTLKNYQKNSLFKILNKKYSKEIIKSVFKKYCVGTSNKWGYSPIFWQKDLNGNIRSGKIIVYNINTTKRIKKPRPKMTWAHSEAKLKDFNLGQVLFGCHLIKGDETSIYCLVESEKTAIVCACEFPDYIWLATGGSQNFKKEMLLPLKGKKVMVYPDIDQHENWTKKAKELRNALGINFSISSFVKIETKILDSEIYSDLADLILLQ